MRLIHQALNEAADFRFQRASDPETLRLVVECLKAVYGSEENYVNPEMFQLGYLIRASACGEICCYLAMVGERPSATMTVRKNKHFESAVELSAMGIAKEYQGFGLLEPFIHFVVGDCLRRGERMFYAHVVMYSRSPQYKLEEAGFFPTGLLPGVVRSELHLAQLQLTNRKLVLAVYMRSDAPPLPVKLYLPEAFVPMAQGLYGKLGIVPEISFEMRRPTGKTRLEAEPDRRHHSLCIYLWEAGADVDRAVNQVVDRQTQPLQTVLILVNINCPGAAWGADRLLRLGYRFAGFKPVYGQQDFLILYHLLNVELNMGELLMSETLSQLNTQIDEGNAAYG